MKEVNVRTVEEWRKWLADNHDKEAEVWLVFNKKETNIPSPPYEAAVEEALCYGWIDSIIRKLSDTTYARKFTPRKIDSRWSALNRKRAERMIKAGKMTEFGMGKIEGAKANGRWYEQLEAKTEFKMPIEFRDSLAKNKRAKKNYESLAFSHRRQYLGWICTAKRPETRQRRIDEAIALLAKGEKLGLK